jgi:hypothetical protein
MGGRVIGGIDSAMIPIASVPPSYQHTKNAEKKSLRSNAKFKI